LIRKGTRDEVKRINSICISEILKQQYKEIVSLLLQQTKIGNRALTAKEFDSLTNILAQV